MKKTVIILSICIMANMTSFGQCNSDSLIYKLPLKQLANRFVTDWDITKKFKKQHEFKYLTIDYAPAFWAHPFTFYLVPDSVKDLLVKDDNLTYEKMSQINDTLSILKNLLYENGVDSTTYKRFLQINDTLSVACHSAHLNRMFTNDKEVIILNKKERKKFDKINSWTETLNKFWKIYPHSGGIMWVSAIGYNDDCTEAIFYFVNETLHLGRMGYFAVCQYESNNWVVKKIIPIFQG